jgi:hypothetical protein
VNREASPPQGADAATGKDQICFQAGLEYVTVADLKFSADGSRYWDGRFWVRALSPDGNFRWNGSEWVPVAAPTTPAMAPTTPAGTYYAPATARVPTQWTKPMQNSVVALQAVTILYLLSEAYLLSATMSQFVNQGLQQSATHNPQASPPPAELVTVFTSLFSVVFWGGAAIGSVVSIVIIIGALNRWRWMFYVVLVFFGLSTIGLPFSLISAVSGSFDANVYGANLLASWLTVALGLPTAALFVWMLVALFRYGPWAMPRTLDWPAPASHAPAG